MGKKGKRQGKKFCLSLSNMVKKSNGKEGKETRKKKKVYCNQLNQSARLPPLSNMVKKSNGKERKKTRKKKKVTSSLSLIAAVPLS